MLAGLGRESLSPATIIGFVGNGVRMLVQRALTASDPGHKPPGDAVLAGALDSFRKHYSDQILVETSLYPGVNETLASLSRQRKAIVTSKEVGFTRTLLSHFGIGEHFECIIGGDTLPEKKPDPAPVLEALRLMSASATESLMIGDSEADILAGQGAGTRTCAVTYGFRTREQLAPVNPDFTIAAFAELLDLIE
jgi:phosphoglycolate phosphatase